MTWFVREKHWEGENFCEQVNVFFFESESVVAESESVVAESESVVAESESVEAESESVEAEPAKRKSIVSQEMEVGC